MKEIRNKYRAKVVNSDRWVHGDLLEYVDDSTEKIIYEIYTDGGIFKPRIIEYIQPDTLGQFTGVIDKFNRDIYEGDLIKSKWGSKLGEVRWLKAEASFVVWYDNTSHEKLQICKSYADMEVIGNIYDYEGEDYDKKETK